MRKINVVGKEARKISPEEFAKAMGAELIGEKKNMDIIDLTSLLNLDYTKLNPKDDSKSGLKEKGLELASETVFVLEHYIPDNRLIGIFSTEAKARRAADWHMQYFKPGKQVMIEEANGETLFSVRDENELYVIHIIEYAVDTAILPDGEWGEAYD